MFLKEKNLYKIAFHKDFLFRRQASLNAVHNCRSKALSIAQLLNQSLGSPILIQEEEVSETKGVFLEEDAASIQSQLELSTIKIIVKVYGVFECAERLKKKTL